MLKREELDQLMQIKGEVRGVVFHTDAAYVLEKEGEEGVKKLESRVKELSYPINYRNPQITGWYPVGLRMISLLLVKDAFGWSNEKIKTMGNTAPKFSFIIKILTKFFISIRKIVEKSPQTWNKHYRNIGKLEGVKVDERGKEAILRLSEFKVHPLFCLYLEGFFARVASLGLTSRKVECKETKCVFRGAPYNEFKITWK
jgi:predicted hydrocarbon binding protein